MKAINHLPILIVNIVLMASIVVSCTKEEPEPEPDPKTTDETLFELVSEASGFTWFKNSADYLDKSSGSGHSQPFLRTRYNAIAATMLDADGKIKADASFPDESLIVKELYGADKTLDQYAVLYKKTGHADADGSGWVWGYFKADGTVVVPASGKGASCIGCHSQAESISYMLMNKFFP